jgi:hypothetical protein
MQQLDVIAPSEKEHSARYAQAAGEHLQALPFRAITRNDEYDIGAVELRQRPQSDVVAFDRFEPSDASDYMHVRRDSELAPQLHAIRQESIGLDAIDDYRDLTFRYADENIQMPRKRIRHRDDVV